MAVILVMTAIGGWAVCTGRVSYVITHGVSMSPVYYQGDLVFVVKANSYRVGQIAAYHGATPGLEVLHRIIAGDGKAGYVFKGDNNQSTDVVYPTADEVIGKAVLHVPKGGIWLKPLLSPTGLGMIGFLIVSGGAAAARTRREIPRGRRKKKVKAMARQGGSWTAAVTVAKTIGRLPPLLRAAAVLTALIAGLGIALAVLGWMKPVAQTRTTDGAAAQSMTFSYSATVPSSAAYDGTKVTSPEPVFRKLADKVDLRVRYLGHPGALDVNATLSDGSGWHSTMQIAPAKRFSGASDDITMTLNLNDFQERARAAAKAIGTAEGAPVTVALTARVTAAGEPAFTAPLNFTLAPLAFTLAGGPGSLVVNSSTTTADATVVPRTIEVLHHPVMTASAARSYAVLLLLGAAVGAVAIALVARRDTPVRTRSEIERRFPQLLVHVEPMASPPGKPVVNVDNFPALVKLAERYGQMILTWSRPDADDFVVRDEGITYRYRVDLETPDAPVPLMEDSHQHRARKRTAVKAVHTATEDRPASHRHPA
jgi:signal peptidase I